MHSEYIRVARARLVQFCQDVFQACGVTAADARVAAEVLVAADARGIPSHGVARLPKYVQGIRIGMMLPHAASRTVMETPTTLVVDAQGALGAPVSAHTMARVIEKARGTGAAFACVRDSNHFGIAAYYAMLALEHDMLGITMTNAAALGVPTFGRQVMFGTNPIAFAAPAEEERAFVLDMSTTVVTKGKVEVYEQLEQELPAGWAVDKAGRSARDPHTLLEDMFNRVGGGILPLGGEGELTAGYKGYGLAVMVDILCAVLCGAPFGPAVADAENAFARVSHFFGALRIDAFREPRAFRRDMDRMLRDLRACPLAEGAERVYIAGQKEFEQEAACARTGVPLLRKTFAQLTALGEACGVAPLACLSS